MKCYLPIEAPPSNEPLHVTAARVRMLLNAKGCIWAAALERER